MSTLHRSHSLVRPWLSSTPAILALALIAVACGSADERPPPPSSADYEAEESSGDLTEDDGENTGSSRGSRCEEGDARECRIKLPKQGSVQNCIDGVRYCENGVWGACVVE